MCWSHPRWPAPAPAGIALASGSTDITLQSEPGTGTDRYLVGMRPGTLTNPVVAED